MNRARSIQLALLLAITFFGAMAWAGWDTMQRSGNTRTNDTGGTAVAEADRGGSMRLVMEVLSVGGGGQFTGRVLRAHAGRYRITAVPVEAKLTADSAVVMGRAADIRPRAVLQLSGRLDDSHRVRVARAVVLTGYVTIER